MAIQDPLAVLCTLFDRSVNQIAEASADARTFDRQLIVRVSDVWDNNTYPLLRAAVGTNGQGARERALTALLWMATFHRTWMVEQAAFNGFDLADSLPPSPPRGPYRDYNGTVRSTTQLISADAVEEISADYDLAAAQVTHFAAERAGRRLDARLSLSMPRRFRADAMCPAAMDLTLSDVTRLEAAATDVRGAAITVGADGLKIALDTQGFVEAATGWLRVDDLAWHLSAAGRRADAEVPPKSDRTETYPELEAELSKIAEEAANSLASAMIAIRGVRYSKRIDLKAISKRCRRCAGAGQKLLDAARQPSADQRDAVLRQLASIGPPLFGRLPKAISARRPAEPAAELRMVDYTAPHQDRYERRIEQSLLRHYAVPPSALHRGKPWQISVLQDPEPSTFAVRTEDFHAAPFQI